MCNVPTFYGLLLRKSNVQGHSELPKPRSLRSMGDTCIKGRAEIHNQHSYVDIFSDPGVRELCGEM